MRFLPVVLLLACGAPDRDDAGPTNLVVPLQVQQKLPADVRSVLENPESFELLSLFPAEEGLLPEIWEQRGYADLERMHRYAVLGKTRLGTGDRMKVLDAVYRGIGDSDGTVAACFKPRHGIRARRGETTVELVICYECLSMIVYRNGAHTGSASTTGKPTRALTAMLKSKGVPLPDR